MHEAVEELAKLQGITSEQLFRKAYDECGGNIFGLVSPENLHPQWAKYRACTPPYVLSYLRKHAR